MDSVRVLLISTYDLGRQPFGLASPAAWLRSAGVEVDCVDTSRERADRRAIATAVAGRVLPADAHGHAARGAAHRARPRVNPAARSGAYGLYAPLNAAWLREQGVTDVLGPEAEEELVDARPGRIRREPGASQPESQSPKPRGCSFIQPDRSGLPPLQRYAALQMPDGTAPRRRSRPKRLAAASICVVIVRSCRSTAAVSGDSAWTSCIEDVRAQVAAGAQHISFGDPDFFNGPTHARRMVERLAAEFPGSPTTSRSRSSTCCSTPTCCRCCANWMPVRSRAPSNRWTTGCSLKLRKGHTRADFVRAVRCCAARRASRWRRRSCRSRRGRRSRATSICSIRSAARLELVDDVAPIQLAIRLLVTAGSALLELAGHPRRASSRSTRSR